MSQSDLPALANSLQIETLEAAWTEALGEPAVDATPYFETITALCRRDMASKALGLAEPMVDALAERDRLDEAMRLALCVVQHGAHNEKLTRELAGLFQRRYGGEPWYPVVAGRAGLEGEPSPEAVAEFERLRHYMVGHAVYHPAGWGEGVVERFHGDREEVTVRFATGRTQDFPLDTVLDRFKPLDDDDLRAMRLLAKDELERLVAEQPSVLVRKAAKIYRGTITSTQVKAELSPSVVPAKKWASFWKRAKAAAAKDPWLKVEGSTTRPVFVLRDKPLSLAEEAATAVSHADDLGGAIATLREYLERTHDKAVHRELLEVAAAEVKKALSRPETASHSHILDGVLMLVEHGMEAPVPAAQEVRALLVDDQGRLQPRSIDQLATQQSREHAVTLLPEALGEDWAALCIDTLTDFPASVVDNVVQLLVDAGHGPRLLDVWDRVAPYPHRHPILTYLVGRLYADGAFDEHDHRPKPVTVGRVVLHLARVLNAERRGNPQFGRLLTRLVSLLAGRRALLTKALEDASREDLRVYLGITERAGSDFPQEITDLVLRAVADRHPDLTAKADRPFWEREYIYVTREGLKRLREAYRVLVEEKIPENSKAIGVAASHGDLSENSEWESAMEEQRNLTSRAATLDAELRSCRLIEDQEIQDDVVAPGTRVTWRETESGEHNAARILGPYDEGEDVVNYKAPLAQKLLGRKVGEEVEVPSTAGTTTVRIESVERAV